LNQGLLKDVVAFHARVMAVRAELRIDFIAAPDDRLQGHLGSAAPPAVVQAFVAGDSVDPGEEARLEPEASEVPEHLEKNRLQDVLRLRIVSERIQDDGPDPPMVGIVEFPDGFRIAVLSGQDESPFALIEIRFDGFRRSHHGCLSGQLANRNFSIHVGRVTSFVRAAGPSHRPRRI